MTVQLKHLKDPETEMGLPVCSTIHVKLIVLPKLTLISKIGKVKISCKSF